MSNGRQVGSPARVAVIGLASAFSLAVAAHALPNEGCSGCGCRDRPIEVLLPFEPQARLFHSLPIAGLVTTPDAIAERVLLNPRLRATTGQPFTGKGVTGPVSGPGVVGTHADPPD